MATEPNNVSFYTRKQIDQLLYSGGAGSGGGGAEIAVMQGQLAQAQTDLTQAQYDLYDPAGKVSTINSTLTGKVSVAQNAANSAQTTANSAASAAAAASGLAGGKADVLIQSSAPIGAMQKSTTLWIDTTGGANTPKRWSGSAWVAVTDNVATAAASAAAFAQTTANVAQQAATNAQATANAANTAAADAQTTANAKTSTYRSATAPTVPAGGAAAFTVGDIWIDTADQNHLYLWGGTSWTDVRDASIAVTASQAAQGISDAAAALSAAQAAQATADGAISTYYQASPPWANGSSQPASKLGDMWYATATNEAYRWDGSAWQLIADTSIATALAAAQSAQATADGKIDAFYQTSQPTSGSVGDLWFDTDDKNRPYYCSSTSPLTWTLVADGRIADAQTAANNAATQAATAITNAQTAQSTADGKAVVFFQATAPTGEKASDVNDLWIDTGNGNRVNRWSGTAWVVAQDQSIATALTNAAAANAAASGAQATANMKITTYYAASAPAAPAGGFSVGDLWIDLGNNSQVKRWSGSAWVLTSIASTSYITARGTDLVTNGTGLLGTNYNFSSFTFVPDAPAGSNGSFLSAVGYAARATDEFIPIDPAKKYVLRAAARETVTSSSLFYAGLSPYDGAGLAISPYNYSYKPATATTLATQVKPGDTTINLTSAAGWSSSNGYLLAWNYTDLSGRVWPAGSYSRWAGLIASIAGNTITLTTGWTGPTLAAGSPVVNSFNSGNYMYALAANQTVPNTWTTYTSAIVTGTTDGSTQAGSTLSFPPGTTQVKMVFLCNYTGSPSGSRVAVAGVSMSDTSAAQVTADAAMTTASGKNTIYWGTAAPPTAASGTKAGDIFNQYQMINSAMVILATWQSDGTYWVSSALSETYLPQVNIGDGTYGELDGQRLQANSVIANNIVVNGSIGNILLTDGTITAQKMDVQNVTAAVATIMQLDVSQLTASSAVINSAVITKLFTQTFAANKITSQQIDAQSIAAAVGTFVQVAANQITGGTISASLTMAAGSAVIAGNPTGVNAQLNGDGSIQTWSVSDDGVQYKSTSLNDPDGSSLEIVNDPTQPAVASISSGGDIVGNSVTSSNDVVIAGQSLIGTLMRPGDVVNRTNYFPTPQDFENGMAAPTYTGSCTAALSQAQARSGTYSCSVTANATATGAQANWSTSGTIMDVNVGDSVVLSAYVYIPSSVTQSTNSAVRLSGTAFSGAVGTTPDWTKLDQWQQVFVTATIATATGTVIPSLCAPATNGQTIYYDDVMLEPGATPTSPTFSGATVSPSGAYTYRYVNGTWIAQEYTPGAAPGFADSLSWGCIARADFTSLVSGVTISAGGSMTPVGQFSVSLNPNRSYQLVMHWRGYSGTTGSYANVTTRFYMTNATDPNGEAPDPTTSSVAIGQQSENFSVTSTGLDDQLVINFTTGDPSGLGQAVQYKFLLGLFANGNSFSPDVTNVTTQDNWVVTIFDTGRVPWPSPVTKPGAGTKRTYVSTWRANNSRSWNNSGTVYSVSGSTTSYIRQGNDGAGHLWYGAFSCATVATSGETTKTIAQALTGGAAIQKAEVWLQITWSAQDVGQAELRPLGANVVPSTMTSPGNSSNIVKNDFPARNTGMWITVPTTWFTLTNDGVILATPDWQFPNTNCQFAGATHSTVAARPQIRLTYTR